MLHVTIVPYVRNPICVFSLTFHDAQNFNNSGTPWRNLFAHMLTADQLDENSHAHTVFLKPTLILSSQLHPVFFQVFPFFDIFLPKFCTNSLFIFSVHSVRICRQPFFTISFDLFAYISLLV